MITELELIAAVLLHSAMTRENTAENLLTLALVLSAVGAEVLYITSRIWGLFV